MEVESFLVNNRGGGGGEGDTKVVELKLPIGFRFRPTDEELVVHYLKRKALSLPFPVPVILDFNVFSSDPWSFPGDLREKRRYYFCKGGNGVESKCKNFTATSFGFWKTNGKVKQIVASSCDHSNKVVGARKLWVFYQKTKNASHGWSRTPWVMHEIQLPKSTQYPDGQKQDWVVCRVFQRKRPNKHGSVASEPLNISRCCNFSGFETPSYIDFKLEQNNFDLGPPQPSSPCCSAEMVFISC